MIKIREIIVGGILLGLASCWVILPSKAASPPVGTTSQPRDRGFLKHSTAHAQGAYGGGGVGSGHVIEDEGIELPQQGNMNFTGAGVTVTDEGGKTVVSIPGNTEVSSFNSRTGAVTPQAFDYSSFYPQRDSNWKFGNLTTGSITADEFNTPQGALPDSVTVREGIDFGGLFNWFITTEDLVGDHTLLLTSTSGLSRDGHKVFDNNNKAFGDYSGHYMGKVLVDTVTGTQYKLTVENGVLTLVEQ